MQDEIDLKIAQLIDMLRVERDVIRSGDFAALPDLVARKEAQLQGLQGTPARRLTTAREMALENQRLLEAAMQGVRSVQARLSAIRQATKSYTSYDRDGRARTISPGDSSVERRA